MIRTTTEGVYKVNVLNDTQALQANILGPETIAHFENEVAALTEELVSTHFTLRDPNELNQQLAEFIYKQSRRETLTAILSDCANAYAVLASNPA